ncbi:MAG: putative glutathione S-transferase-related transrane protein [Devosia sp.]|nr:putative glutathione S-transferase-related transrane protein [Devosia sp.]
MDDLKIDAPAGKAFVNFTRTFNAPRELVWRALSQPEHVVNWFGPAAHANTVLEFDWRVGGKWKIRSVFADGGHVDFHGEYREIARPERVVKTFGMVGMYDDMVSIDTVELEEVDGKTIYRAHSELASIEARNGMMASGMESGAREGYARLDAMLENWQVNA